MKSLLTAALVTGLAATAHANPQIDVIAVSGDPTPDGNGTFDGTFSPPILNDNGTVAFEAGVTGTTGGANDGEWIIVGDTNVLSTVVAEGQPALDGNGTFASFPDGDLQLNNSGQVLTGVFYNSSNDTRRGVVRGDGTSLVSIYRQGDPDPVTGNGSFGASTGGDLGASGQAAFVQGTQVTPQRLFLGDGTTTQALLNTGDASPDGSGTVTLIGATFQVNPSDRVLAGIQVDDGGGDEYLLLTIDSSSSQPIFRQGDASPEGNGVFNTPSSVALDAAGNVTFTGALTGTAEGNADDRGLYRYDALTDTVSNLAREGQPVPGGDGEFGKFGVVVVNETGDFALSADLTDTTASQALFYSDGSTISEVYRQGDVVPGGDGEFLGVGGYAINEAGQLALQAFITNTASTEIESALYLWDPVDGISELLRSGDPLLGSTIDSAQSPGGGLRFATGSDFVSGFNDTGVPQLAFSFGLEDGTTGIGLYTIPEPTTAALVALGGLAILRRTRRHA